ncbi:MAG: dihydroorotase family protein [Chlamydiales bacterium]
MIEITNVQTLEGKVIDKLVPSQENQRIDGRGLTLFPGLIDPHVHFRTPGLEYKENWLTGASAAIHGGITTVFDMPNTIPSTIAQDRVREKSRLIDVQLRSVDIPLRYGLYLGADKHHFDEIEKSEDEIVGIKVFMGSSTGELLMDDEESLHTAFSLAKKYDLLLAVHAEDEQLLAKQRALFLGATDPAVHSKLRSREVAIEATRRAISLAKKYGTRLYLLHIGTKEEVELIAQAKKEGVALFAETSPHHLFLTEEDYKKWGTKVQMNPPLRTKEDGECLWNAIRTGVIDTIGSDHAPHTLEEKNKPYGQAPSGIPGVETTLPLLLDAYQRKRISLKEIVNLMRENILKIFRREGSEDFVLVDLHKMRLVDEKKLKSRCGWSPYHGRQLTGWPIYTILQGRVYDLQK